ncbi:hypothetical protein Cabys_1142 [Caldithrix abyssi DSM 13497]|uniref:Uncharacterized protein n=1 Tax=Caldithrix abyssi DSM 13497 TaxID=880073 RepID=A0A1J1C5D4_CALAY|nr:hypothetical protein Cabys_1142 [Caldithrix abyssi DSM 13497]
MRFFNHFTILTHQYFPEIKMIACLIYRKSLAFFITAQDQIKGEYL